MEAVKVEISINESATKIEALAVLKLSNAKALELSKNDELFSSALVSKRRMS